MHPSLRRKLAGGLAVILSGGILFALGDSPQMIDKLTNYPNPFDCRKEETFITYQLPQDMAVRIKIYDLFGYMVNEFYFSAGEAGGRSGENVVRWNGSTNAGDKVSTGGYICQVTVEGDQTARSMRKIGVIH